jgi:hypothetical protein
MKTKILLPDESNVQILVNKGDKITPGSIIAKYSGKKKEVLLNISDLLGVRRLKIGKYLKKKIGDEIEIDEVIAERKSLFSSSQIKSSCKGIFKDIDLTRGTITITEKTLETKNISAFIGGRVFEIDEKGIEIYFDGKEYEAESLTGSESSGRLVFLKEGILNAVDVNDSVIGSVVLCRDLREDALIKMDVLEVSGIILSNDAKTRPHISSCRVSNPIFEELMKNHNCHAWLKLTEGKIYLSD